MAQATAAIIDKPAWVDLSSSDAQASRGFYSKVFGWKVEVNPDPQYGGYAIAKLGDKDAAGIGPAPKASPTTSKGKAGSSCRRVALSSIRSYLPSSSSSSCSPRNMRASATR